MIRFVYVAFPAPDVLSLVTGVSLSLLLLGGFFSQGDLSLLSGDRGVVCMSLHLLALV